MGWLGESFTALPEPFHRHISPSVSVSSTEPDEEMSTSAGWWLPGTVKATTAVSPPAEHLPPCMDEPLWVANHIVPVASVSSAQGRPLLKSHPRQAFRAPVGLVVLAVSSRTKRALVPVRTIASRNCRAAGGSYDGSATIIGGIDSNFTTCRAPPSMLTSFACGDVAPSQACSKNEYLVPEVSFSPWKIA